MSGEKVRARRAYVARLHRHRIGQKLRVGITAVLKKFTTTLLKRSRSAGYRQKAC